LKLRNRVSKAFPTFAVVLLLWERHTNVSFETNEAEFLCDVMFDKGVGPLLLGSLTMIIQAMRAVIKRRSKARTRYGPTAIDSILSNTLARIRMLLKSVSHGPVAFTPELIT